MYRVYGQERVKQILGRSIERKRHAHAYLFHGQSGVGKDTMAVAAAMRLFCLQPSPWACGECSECRKIIRLEHPSFHLIYPVPSRPSGMKAESYDRIIREKLLERMDNLYRPVDFHPEFTTLPAISIQQVRDMKKTVLLKTSESSYRIFIVSQVQRMSAEAANSLLKLLEEPPPRTMLILTSDVPGQILDTIKSRCQMLRFDRIPEEVIAEVLRNEQAMESAQADLFSRMSGGSMQRALELAGEDFNTLRDEAISFLTMSLGRDTLQILDYAARSGRSKNKQKTLNMLQLLQVIMRDLLQTDIESKAALINSDKQAALSKILSRHPGLDAGKAIGFISEAIDYIGKNVYLPLILTTLSDSLREST